MRTPSALRRTGAGRALLNHIIDVARSRGYEVLYLETGRHSAFAPGPGAIRQRQLQALRPIRDLPGKREQHFHVALALGTAHPERDREGESHDGHDLPQPQLRHVAQRARERNYRESGEKPVVIEYLKDPPSRDRLRGTDHGDGNPGAGALCGKKEPLTPSWGWGIRNGRTTNCSISCSPTPILINRPIVATPKGVKLCSAIRNSARHTSGFEH